ncbi:DUF2505 domain-containing protein [Rhodococcus sp. NPDC058521]|uniref:DUF2505 domain-containing protein n=1 Tax=Rhodococcus sp. NPDC058521 TaxID=3346536 RepID=UPI003660B45F
MPKRFATTIELDHDVEAVHAALTDEAYWQYRLRESETAQTRIESPGPGALSVTVTETTDPEKFPAVVRAVVRGPMKIERTDSWGPLSDGRAEGSFGGSTTALPLTIDGSFVLRGSGAGSVIDVDGAVTVKIRLVGGQIEALAKQMVMQMVERDGGEIRDWLTR